MLEILKLKYNMCFIDTGMKSTVCHVPITYEIL